MKMRYFGYDFEVPWNDVEEADRKPFASKSFGSDSAWVSFRSGLKLFISVEPPDAAISDYAMARLLYEFNPSTMQSWPPSPRTQYRQLALFVSKSVILSHIPSTPAESGIYNLRSQTYRGFQLGNAQARQDGLSIELYFDDGRFETVFLQEAYEEPSGVTQPEINRIVQTLHKAPSSEASSSPAVASK